MTISEQVFEKLCINKNITYKKILEDIKSRDGKSSKSPDYEININGSKIIIEIKELRGDTRKNKKLNKTITEQLKENRVKQLKNGQQILYHQSNTLWQPSSIRNSFHKHIKKANKQLKINKYIKYPAILIIHNNINYKNLNDFTCSFGPNIIDNFMYNISGTSTEFIEDIKDWGNLPFVYKQEEKAEFTPYKHTQISAIGLLSKRTFPNIHEFYTSIKSGKDINLAKKMLAGTHNEIKLQIFHNIFAKISLNIEVMKMIAYEQYKNTFDTNNNSTPANLIKIDC